MRNMPLEVNSGKMQEFKSIKAKCMLWVIQGLCGNLSKPTGGTLGSRVSVSLGEALACLPSLPEVPSLLLVEIVAGRGCLPLQTLPFSDKQAQSISHRRKCWPQKPRSYLWF